jgi:hypothetical protein
MAAEETLPEATMELIEGIDYAIPTGGDTTVRIYVLEIHARQHYEELHDTVLDLRVNIENVASAGLPGFQEAGWYTGPLPVAPIFAWAVYLQRP